MTVLNCFHRLNHVDIKSALEQPELLTAVVALDLMAPVDRAIHHDERLHRATEYFAHSDFERLPVVDGEGRVSASLPASRTSQRCGSTGRSFSWQEPDFCLSFTGWAREV